jgi:replicative DNA helicase
VLVAARMTPHYYSHNIPSETLSSTFLTEAQEWCATPPARAVELTVAKNRHGDTGKMGLLFRPDMGTMRHEHTVGPPR